MQLSIELSYNILMQLTYHSGHDPPRFKSKIVMRLSAMQFKLMFINTIIQLMLFKLTLEFLMYYNSGKNGVIVIK